MLSDDDTKRLAEHYAHNGETAIRPKVAPLQPDVPIDLDDGQVGVPPANLAGASIPSEEARFVEISDVRQRLISQGAELATTAGTGCAAFDRPVCAACHGRWPEPITERYPRIAGQHEAFLLTQLRLWKTGRRGGTGLAGLMHEVVRALEDGDLRALAAYYANLPPAVAGFRQDSPPEGERS